MELDPRTCYRALSTRDSRFDGRFFTGVRSTGVFCRPVCPAPTPKRDNCTYFACAAAALEAGFRPCLRCRPELSPGHQVWNGTTTTVQRALQLIDDGALDGHDVPDLAERLGVGDRHLRRLFTEHLGTTPLAVAQMRRVLFAKQLIADTALPMSHIAQLAGFANVRRFNAAMQRTYGRPPRDLRRTVAPGASPKKAASSTTDPGVTLLLSYRPPLAWDAMLSFLRRRALPGVEIVTDTTWKRTVDVDGVRGVVEVGPSKRPNHLRARIDLPQPTGIWAIVRRLRRLFDLDSDPQRIEADLQRHARLRRLVQATPGLRIPGCWDPFELALRAVLGQQVSVAAATTLAGRLVERWGTPLPRPVDGLTHVFPAPAALVRARFDTIGLTRSRARTLRHIASATASGAIRWNDVTDTASIRAQLLSIPGIGAWTTEYVALRALREPDAFPASDLGLRQALGRDGTPACAVDVQHIAEPWRPWRGYAALHLWHELSLSAEGVVR